MISTAPHSSALAGLPVYWNRRTLTGMFAGDETRGTAYIGVFFAGFVLGVTVAVLLRPPGDVRRVVHFFSLPPADEACEAPATAKGIH